MTSGQQAAILVDGELLPDIEDQIKQEYFDEWQSAATVEDREAIHAKQAALEMVLFTIKEKAKKVLIQNGE